MPPLLPEYLSQPVQIVIQSSSGWEVWIGAAATLIGAAIGAGLGAFFSYGAAKKSSERAFALKKAETLHALAQACRTDIQKLDLTKLSSLSSYAFVMQQREKKQLLEKASDRFDMLYEQLHIFSSEQINRDALLDSHALWHYILYTMLNPDVLVLPKWSPNKSSGSFKKASSLNYSKVRFEYDTCLANICDELALIVRKKSGR